MKIKTEIKNKTEIATYLKKGLKVLLSFMHPHFIDELANSSVGIRSTIGTKCEKIIVPTVVKLPKL